MLLAERGVNQEKNGEGNARPKVRVSEGSVKHCGAAWQLDFLGTRCVGERGRTHRAVFSLPWTAAKAVHFSLPQMRLPYEVGVYAPIKQI